MKIVAPLAETTEDDLPVRRLTADEARRLRERNPQLSPWRVILAQMALGLAVALIAWAWSGKLSVGWSAGYGALAVVIPAAIFVRGLTGRFSSLNAVSAAVGFMLWEMVKIALTVAMLFAAPRLVADLSWPAMLVGLVVTMQAYWAALVLAPRKTKRTDE